jgi:Polyketide cyclase / dehydrase and lipid transport
MRWAFRAAVAIAGLGAVYAQVVRGALALDLGIGRRIRPLGPLRMHVAAPREVVFDVVAEPYLNKTPRGLSDKLQVLERGSDLVLAAHVTDVGWGLAAATVETVRFERPERIGFRLVRGPVPHVVETFELRDIDGETEFEYRGELGTDLWALGRWWGARVARLWEQTVATSLDSVRTEAERRARSSRRPAPPVG